MKTYNEFLKLGSETHITYQNPFVKWFIKKFGPLGVNAKIRNAHIINKLQQQTITNKNNLKLLDAGCGLAYSDFWFAKKFTSWKIVGLDIDPENINKNNIIKSKLNLNNIMFYEKDLVRLDYKNKFDIIYSMDVLEHIENDILVLEKFYDALKENGLLILHLPLNYELCERILPGYKNFDTHDHVRPEYTAEEITEKLIRVGFKIKELDYTYAKYGEIAFELNYLLWQVPSIRLFFAFITHPIVMRFAYKEIQYVSKKGNAMVILAQKPNDKKG